VAKMKLNLDDYLHSVGAKFPRADDRYRTAAGLAKQQQIRDKLLPQLERQHAEFHQPDFQPNRAWWGSRVED
jgi:hypothetical protein